MFSTTGFGASSVRVQFLAGAGMAAVLVLAIGLAGLAASIRSSQPTSAGTTPSTAQSSGCGEAPGLPAGATYACTSPAPADATPSSGPTLRPTTAQPFTTPGLTSNWSGFSWTGQSQVFVDGYVQWAGGFAAITVVGEGNYSIWLSRDGQTWTPMGNPGGLNAFLLPSPSGLVVLTVEGDDPSTRAYEVWSSPDGASWADLGKADIHAVISVAGTSSGIVATVMTSAGIQPSGKEATATDPSYAIEFSTDGLHWTAESPSGIALQNQGTQPTVRAVNGRFFLSAASTSGGALPRGALASSGEQYDSVYWSDDGRTWTRSGGSYMGFAGTIDAARDGLILHTATQGTPGRTGMAVSTDGGKTWTDDPNYGPLGSTNCEGEGCGLDPDGVIAGNGTYLVAVKDGGQQAWLSTDAKTWIPIAWSGGDPGVTGTKLLVLPRGVLLGGYGAAR